MDVLRGIMLTGIMLTSAALAMGASCDSTTMLQVSISHASGRQRRFQHGGSELHHASKSKSFLEDVFQASGMNASSFRDIAEQGLQLLEAGSTRAEHPQCSPDEHRGRTEGCRGTNFADVHITLPLKTPIIERNGNNDGHGFIDGSKNLIGEEMLRKHPCVAFGIGVNDDSRFEQQLAKDGCVTHAFDCTVSVEAQAVKGKDFAFHNWCIGKRQSAKSTYGRTLTDGQFKGLHETMQELQVANIDILKFDIEGFEWQLFEDEILTLPKLPTQLLFELHTEGAAEEFVPKEVVKGKDFREVDKLFLRLHEKGYRVVSKEVNMGDHHCSEFVLLNVA